MLILAFLLLALGAAVIYVRCCGFVVWKTALLFAGCFIALNLFYLVVAWVASWFVNPSKPLSRQNSLCRSACVYASIIVTGYCWVRTHVRGAEKLPEAGRFLMVSNHRSGFDPIVVTQLLRRFSRIRQLPVPWQSPFLRCSIPCRKGNRSHSLPLRSMLSMRALAGIPQMPAAMLTCRHSCSVRMERSSVTIGLFSTVRS